jgi:hypothetical protein
MFEIRVTGSKWVDGAGWSFTEDLESMEINSMEDLEGAAKSYAAEFSKNFESENGGDYQLRFYSPEDEGQENPLVKVWLSESTEIHLSKRVQTNAEELCSDFAPLYLRHSGQINAQLAHIEIDPEKKIISAEINQEIGNAVPIRTWNGRAYRVTVSALLSGAQAAALLESTVIQSLAERVIAGYSCEWDGSNYVGRLTEDAKSALEEMEQYLMEIEPEISVWAPEEWFTELPDLAGQSDDYLFVLADQLCAEANSTNVYIDGDVYQFLRDRRDGK